MTSLVLSPSCLVLGITVALGVSPTVYGAERPGRSEAETIIQEGEHAGRCTAPRSAAQKARLGALGITVFKPALPGLGLKSRTTRQRDLLQRFGQPRDVTRSLWASNLYDPPPDGYEHIVWDFAGLTISTLGDRRSAKDDPERWLFIDQIIVDGDRDDLQHGFKIGLSRSDVISLLGCAPNDHGRTLHYDNEKPAYQIVIWLDDVGRVKQSQWRWDWH